MRKIHTKLGKNFFNNLGETNFLHTIRKLMGLGRMDGKQYRPDHGLDVIWWQESSKNYIGGTKFIYSSDTNIFKEKQWRGNGAQRGLSSTDDDYFHVTRKCSVTL